MDFGSRRTKSVPKAHDIEICELSGGSLRFESARGRVSRILRLARDNNPANAVPDRLCRGGAVLFAVLSAINLLVWGAAFRNVTLLLTVWSAISVVIALPALTAVYFRQALGMASKLHKFSNISLTLSPDRVIIEMRRNRLFRGKHPPTVRKEFLYSRISRLEYDRSAKTLRLISAAGTAGASLDVVMFYDDSEFIISEIEKRSGVFIHPAMRGDDYADLSGLPGLRHERPLLRPMCMAVLGFCLITLLTAVSIRAYNQKNPYMPYPPTDEAYLTGTFGIGDTVTLDGCDITLAGVSRAGGDSRGSCYQFIVNLHNRNSSAIRLRSGEFYKDSPGNIIFTAQDGEGSVMPLETSGPPLGHVGVNLPLPRSIAGGRGGSVTFFVWVPDGAKSVTMTANSDYWPPADILRDVTYSGFYTDIGGLPVKANETRFTVNVAELE
jgi:hypothetical protein